MSWHTEIGTSPGSAGYSLSGQGLRVRGCHTCKGSDFRHVLREALLASRRSGQLPQEAAPH